MNADKKKALRKRLYDLMSIVFDPDEDSPWVPRAKAAGFTDEEIVRVQKAAENQFKKRSQKK